MDVIATIFILIVFILILLYLYISKKAKEEIYEEPKTEEIDKWPKIFYIDRLVNNTEKKIEEMESDWSYKRNDRLTSEYVSLAWWLHVIKSKNTWGEPVIRTSMAGRIHRYWREFAVNKPSLSNKK